MANKEPINSSVSEGPLCAKLLDIVKHTTHTDIELKCDICGHSPVLVFCTNCAQCYCKVCHEQHSKENNEHDITLLNKASFCSEHNKSHEYYCEKCDQFVCFSCKARHNNEDHHINTIDEMASSHRNIQTEVDGINKALYNKEFSLTHTQRNLEKQLAEVQKNIDNHYERQLRRLKESCNQLKMKLKETGSQKLKVLEGHLEKIKSMKYEVDGVNKMLEDLRNTSDQKVFSTRKQTVEFYVQRAKNQSETLTSKPVDPGLVMFDPFMESLELLGHLFIDVNFSEVHCLPKRVSKGETIECLILAKDGKNQYCTEGGSQVSIKFELSTGEITTEKAMDNNDGTYTARVKATQTGEATLSVSIDGLQIKGSPFTIEVVPKQDAVAKQVAYKNINLGGSMGKPWGIAFGTNMWAVTDDTKSCVYIFDSQNCLAHKFGEQGSKDGKFNRPFGVAFDSNDHLYVVDGGNHRVQKFSISGKQILQFGSRGDGDGELNGPFGIAIHRYTDKVYVADFHNKRVSMFNTEGQFCRSFGDDCLAGPQDVTISPNNQVLVADYASHKIYTFSLNGDLVSSFGQQGISEGELNHPLSITATWNESILIGDENHCVSIFSKDGQYLCCLGSCLGNDEGKLNFPNGIATKSNSIYVTDWTNQRVQIFKLPI